MELVADGTEMKSLEERQKEKETEREIKEDIEHILVEDDPRLWSSRRKTVSRRISLCCATPVLITA